MQQSIAIQEPLNNGLPVDKSFVGSQMMRWLKHTNLSNLMIEGLICSDSNFNILFFNGLIEFDWSIMFKFCIEECCVSYTANAVATNWSKNSLINP